MASFHDEIDRLMERLKQNASNHHQTEEIEAISNNKQGRQLLSAIAGNSSFLSKLLEIQWNTFAQLLQIGPEALFDQIIEDLEQLNVKEITQEDMYKALRVAKQKAALTIATADIAGSWEVLTVTRSLSVFAELCIKKGTQFLLHQAVQKGEFKPADINNIEKDSGLLILGMGKLGAYELNYSSDVDLIILFDKETAPYVGSRDIQHFFTRFAQDLSNLLQERSSDGYVFRTDLRLRPDPRSTPLAVNVHAAITYYETLGQNWERAAMIKARMMAGDLITDAMFERSMSAYIWRKHLDFHAIADIHSIKRQMNVKAADSIQLAGHNVKLGHGGIREIEFYVQTKQLVWGGRQPELRCKPTLEALEILVSLGHVEQEDAQALHDAYLYLRRVEHFLQMINDQQTHTLPENEDELNHVATFLGYPSLDAFSEEFLSISKRVHQIYSDSMDDAPPLAVEGNLVFTGVDADPETLKTLSKMGYQNPKAISDMIQDWHRGNRRSTRSRVARQILTELVPTILTSLAHATKPDSAFFRFDDFLAKLPAGVQIFSMLAARPELLQLLGHVLGSAPALSDTLGKHPQLLDSVLDGDFYEPLPKPEPLKEALTHHLDYIHEYEMQLEYLRTFKNERHFQAGIQLLQGMASPARITRFLSDIADIIIEQAAAIVTKEFSINHGHIPDGDFAIVALGKLGSRELTFGSDLDLILLYDAPDMMAQSDGSKSIDTRSYYNRLASRLLNACTMMTREGILYEVDTRLRPAGIDSTLATSFEMFDAYYDNTAWLFEFMALTKARVIASTNKAFTSKIERAVNTHLTKPRNHDELLDEVTKMRSKIATQHYTVNPWHIKHVRGGTIDLDFFAQYLALKYSHTHPEIMQSSTHEVIKHAKSLKLLDEKTANTILQHNKLLLDLLAYFRLCSNVEINESYIPEGLAKLLTTHFKTDNFEALKNELLKAEADVLSLFQHMADY